MISEEDQYRIDKRIELANEYLKDHSLFMEESGLQPKIYPIGGNYLELISSIRIEGPINVDDLPELYKILKGQE